MRRKKKSAKNATDPFAAVSRSKGNFELTHDPIIITLHIVEHTLVWMQMLGGVFLRTTESVEETCEMIRMFTKVCSCMLFG